MDKTPFKIHPNTGDPFLQLPSPHSNVVLTSPRPEYADVMAEILNHPEVYPFVNAPYPHTKENAQQFIQQVRQTTDYVWSEIEALGTGSGYIFGGIPVRSICEIQSDGTWLYLGDFGFGRGQAKDILDPEVRKQVSKVNQERPIGDPAIVWSAGYYLRPSHHGRGIIPAVFKTVLDEWAIPYMHVRHIKSDTRVDNQKSQRVFEKLGFSQIGDVGDALKLPESKGGGSFSLRFWELHVGV